MSESETPALDPNEWVWQGFEADTESAAAGKLLTDVDQRAGARFPMSGLPPVPWNKRGTRMIWAVQTRRGNPIGLEGLPAGCEEATAAMTRKLLADA